ncbi:response regulator [Tranquillimonas alkanivorans]|uniref:Response regulator receiver domain-containing protein n=1 Tax=Tranquillimonas alkanivorans TaxID=441119 RepID=A0A1I5Q932_9RHOB|nr:response regulator [Tranquillimonas alkanivorans]SFP42511.1 Response regulator receiver domain-containing protein [Tranquillimonas alkanivorans]
MKILAVDDDPLLLELLETTLESSGYENVSLASSGPEALRLLDSALKPYQCILLDIQMPEMDGIELCARIRRMDAYRDVPILMITAMTERSFVERAFTAGANDYISKPFDPFELTTRLRLAGERIEQQRAVSDKVFAIQSMKQELERTSRFAPDQPIQIEDVSGVVDQVMLENHLLRLPRADQYQAAAVAFRIEEFDYVYAMSRPSELFLLLTDVAECISEQFKHGEFLMSYAGSGSFVCLTQRTSPALDPQLLTRIQDSIDGLELEYENGRPCNISLVMGKPASKPLFFGGQPTTIIYEALESARVATRPKRSFLSVVHSRAANVG